MADDNKPPVEENKPPVEETPPGPTAEDLLLEAKREAAVAKTAATKAQNELKELKVAGLKSKEDYKALAEIEKARADDAEASKAKLEKALIDDKKYSVLREEAAKQGINPISIPDLELLDFSEVVAESSNGRVVVSGAQAAITKLKASRPNWFTAAVPRVNSTTPEGGSNPPNGNVTLADVKAAEAKYYSSKSDSDKKTYEDTIKKFKAQG